MTMMQVYWTGSVPVSKVSWIHRDDELELPEWLEDGREREWRKLKEDYPDSYDGDVLVLRNYRKVSSGLSLETCFMKFSALNTLQVHGEHLRPYGSIGMQMIVLSPDKKSILYGQRAANILYCPLFHSVPGGILEVRDTKGSFEDAVLREFREEVKLPSPTGLNLISIVSEIHGSVGCIFIIKGVMEVSDGAHSIVRGNDEWMNEALHWHHADSLQPLDEKSMLEGLLLAKHEWSIYKSGGKSLVWS
jgi:ADP-ribose pyrophosphatase YjhB (NUDIX family)